VQLAEGGLTLTPRVHSKFKNEQGGVCVDRTFMTQPLDQHAARQNSENKSELRDTSVGSEIRPFSRLVIAAQRVRRSTMCVHLSKRHLSGFNIRNQRLSRACGPNCGLRGGEGVGGMIAFRRALSRRYRLHQSERKISQSSGCVINLSAYIDMVALWRDMATFFIFFNTRN
jgi:hypothetical protein